MGSFQIQWLTKRFGSIPKFWSTAPLGDLFEERRETSSDTTKYPLHSLIIGLGIVPKTDRYNRAFLLRDEKGNQYKLVYPGDFVFKPGRDNYFSYLKENIPEARKSGARVGVSVVCVEDEDNLDFLLAAEEAGADYVSYCAHSTMRMFMETNTSSAMLLKKNWKGLERLTSRLLQKITVPIIFKIGAFDYEDIAESIEFLKGLGVRIIHINIIANISINCSPNLLI